MWNFSRQLRRVWIVGVTSCALLRWKAAGSSDPHDFETDCRTQGFDPFHLSCDTCRILPTTAAAAACHKCCQAYKTVNTTVERHNYAILFHIPNSFQSQRLRMMGGGTPDDEVQQFLQDENGIVELLPKGRFQFVQLPQDAAYTMEASTLYWLEAPPPKRVLDHPQEASRILEQLATSFVHVDGWKKDDLKDMLLTLLKDD